MIPAVQYNIQLHSSLLLTKAQTILKNCFGLYFWAYVSVLPRICTVEVGAMIQSDWAQVGFEIPHEPQDLIERRCMAQLGCRHGIGGGLTLAL